METFVFNDVKITVDGEPKLVTDLVGLADADAEALMKKAAATLKGLEDKAEDGNSSLDQLFLAIQKSDQPFTSQEVALLFLTGLRSMAEAFM